jgi:ketosteroid isomerase-like protein
MSTEATLREMENKWEAAYGTHDPSVAQAYVASDFVGVSPKFKFTTKSSLLSDFKKDKDTYTSTKNESLKVTSFGPNVAVVAGRAREKGTAKDGKAFDRTYYFTDTWMMRGGQWQCIASQASEMRK